jgi:hypothetical protein
MIKKILQYNASVVAACRGSGVTAIAAAVTAAIEEVTLTLSGRDVPANAYAAIGTEAVYRPTSTGKPAIAAYTMACGITTAAVVKSPTIADYSIPKCAVEASNSALVGNSGPGSASRARDRPDSHAAGPGDDWRSWKQPPAPTQKRSSSPRLTPPRRSRGQPEPSHVAGSPDGQ